MENELALTDSQRERFKKLWWVFGNSGSKCTLFNHKLVQGFYEYGENRIKAYIQGNKNAKRQYGKEWVLKHGVTQECIDACQEILNNP